METRASSTDERRSNGPAARLARLRSFARWFIQLERLWPSFMALFSAFCVFLTISWLGGWLYAPFWVKIILWALVGVAFLAPALLAVQVRRATEQDAVKRLDKLSQRAHRPVSATLDSNASDNALARRLWALHQEEASANAGQLSAPQFTPGTALRDPFAIRAALIVAMVASGFIAGPEKLQRVLAAFDLSSPEARERLRRLDAWIDPPAYTGRAPIVLFSSGGASTNIQAMEAPVGSIVVVRSPEKLADVIISVEGLERVSSDDAQGAAFPSAQEARFVLRKDSRIVLRAFSGTRLTFDLTAIADKPPAIGFRGAPATDGKGMLSLAYQMTDDYGVASAEAVLSDPQIRGRKSSGAPLFEAPTIPLALPAGGQKGEANTLTNLVEHPWAGAETTIRLLARDEGGNVGESEDLRIYAPEREFSKPLAKALIEQRRNLVFFPKEKRFVLAALDAISTAPDRFPISAGQHLGIRVLLNQLHSARTDDDLRSIVGLMWEMALQIEEGDMSSAEQALRAAQENLRAALERGAEQDELRRLMDELRSALDRFLRELAENSERQDQRQEQNDRPDPERMITSQDLQRMLDEIERLARSGNPEDAKRALSQLQDLLKNLQSAKKGQERSAQQTNRALNQLDQMMRDQQQLRDRTFRPNANQQRGEGEGDQDLQQGQGELRQRLQDLQRRMREFGMRTDEGLEDAEGAMREAEQQLGRGGAGRQEAVDAQGRAIDGLRRGAESLARQMQQGDQNEGAQAGGQPGQAGRNASSDPLGRESRSRGDQSRSAYDPLGTPAPQRAQQLLEELRRRLADPNRPSIELDYLERLLRRY